MKHLNLTPKQFCDETEACEEGRKFALTQQTMSNVWDHCPRPEWLLWILDTIDVSRDDKQLRLFAVWCARNTPMLDGRVTSALLTDPRSIAALEVAERYAYGTATAVELVAARVAAINSARDSVRASAWAAAWAAAWTAAEAVAAAEAGAAARSAAEAAAEAAVEAAVEAVALTGAWDAAWTATRAAQVYQLRKMIANPFAQGGAT